MKVDIKKYTVLTFTRLGYFLKLENIYKLTYLSPFSFGLFQFN